MTTWLPSHARHRGSCLVGPPKGKDRPAGGRRLFGLRRRSQSGAALLEFALVVPIFVFVLYGLVAFGMMLALKQSVTNAATDGARSAIGATNPVSAATAAVAQRLNWLGGKYNPVTDLSVPAPVPCPNDVTHQCITVSITYPYSSRPLIPPAPGLNLVTPSSFHSEATVQIS